MRYFLGLLAFVAFIILVIVVVTHSGPKTNTKTANGTKVMQLTDYIDKDSEVRIFADGPINAREEHRAIEIDVTASSRTMTIYKDYDLSVIRRKTYSNDEAAYDHLLRALSQQGFINAKTKVKQTDERGVCPTGFRYMYELRENGKLKTRLWTTSCSKSQGTFAGLADPVQDLFQKQIPDYDLIIQSVR